LALFFSIEKEDILRLIKTISPKDWEENILKLWERSQNKVSNWFGSRVLCSIGVALLTFLTCCLFKVRFAFSLSLLAGALNILPFLGPLVSGAALVLIAFLDSWVKALWVAVICFIIQQIDNNIFTPLFTKKW